MINKNSSSKTKPFLLKPAGKSYLWGGNRLNDDFSKGIDLMPLAETWECSTHPDGPSTVACGEHAGRLLSEVLKEHPDYLGTHPRTEGELPILIKFIDAKKDLSIQVHPDDAYAKEYENGSLGKTEMWYVLDASRDASLIYGFYHDMDKETLQKSLQQGTIEKYLQKVRIEKDDVFYIEAGTVHAIGAGALIAEVQESSNLTYRLYDYDRVDKNGRARELHIDKALDVANLKRSSEPRQPVRVLKYANGCASEFLCRCKYFQVERLLINTERSRQMVRFRTNSNSFQVLLCINGCGVLFMEDGESINFFKGDCIFVPADSILLKLHGKAQILKVCC
ncbi:putative mannose-6-phosphate isomerase YvyI [Desulfosporosinus acididurans]|uniref:mannose-6-phosphate isomerase n=1 Tax=Desulfosporosinus acididurans TaxID=476652 RepID=A0A0J1IN54_9FIRM|nr:mannose-6-phosphate isomerase, class I [Desulfosporosinus acididurans]KLU66116.1 putative mannose-6-phosphate isomerase YvyI [Desulfosporosinus acididurans]